MFRIYDISKPDEWKAALLKARLYYLPYQVEYLNLWQINNDGNAILFYHENDYGAVVYPFLRRKLENLYYISRELEGDYFDIITPYGYGGPFIISDGNNLHENIIKEFCLEFTNYCKDNNIISEFIRFHPLYENHIYFSKEIEIALKNKVVYVDLSASKNDIWNNYEYNNKKNIKKALKSGIEIIIDNDLDYMDRFIDIYYTTMNRRKAKKYYYFSNAFFTYIKDNFKEKAILFLAKKSHEIISVELALYDNNIIYSFLGGTLEQYFILRPNNLLKHELILWAKEKGLRYYLIGGGYSLNDGIFNYKKSFSKNGIKEFYVGKKIHNIIKYNELKEELKKYLFNNYPEIKLEEIEYFPIYRFSPTD